MKSNQVQAAEPLLVSRSVARSDKDLSMPGNYDEKESIWVFSDGDRSLPLVQAHKDLAALSTKTEADHERDDVDIDLSPSLLNLLTKTKAHQERDD